MGFCTEAEYTEFMHTCPEFERMLVRSGIMLVKYWFSASDDEQGRRFQDRMKNPTKRWKLSPMDLESRKHWAEYSRAKDEMFAVNDLKQSPWYVVNAENKKCARLSLIPYRDLTPRPLPLPSLNKAKYTRPPIYEQTFIPETYKYRPLHASSSGQLNLGNVPCDIGLNSREFNSGHRAFPVLQ